MGVLLGSGVVGSRERAAAVLLAQPALMHLSEEVRVQGVD